MLRSEGFITEAKAIYCRATDAAGSCAASSSPVSPRVLPACAARRLGQGRGRAAVPGLASPKKYGGSRAAASLPSRTARSNPDRGAAVHGQCGRQVYLTCSPLNFAEAHKSCVLVLDGDSLRLGRWPLSERRLGDVLSAMRSLHTNFLQFLHQPRLCGVSRGMQAWQETIICICLPCRRSRLHVEKCPLSAGQLRLLSLQSSRLSM